METHPADYAHEKTRRIVRRAALKRASRMIQGWRQDAHENTRLAKRIASALTLAALVGAVFFILF